MQRKNLAECTVWVQQLPSILNAADGYGFVISGVLAFAATHLAWLTNSTETKNMAYHHRGVALKGLHDAIGHFSQENSDAILAASILLSWQASECLQIRLLTRFQILSSMHQWKETSLFASFINTHPGFFSARPLTHASPFADDQALLTAIDGLQRLSMRLANNRAVAAPLKEMFDLAQSVLSYSATMQSEQIFAKLQPLRAWLFWTPVSLLSGDETKATDLVLLAQLYAVALAVDFSLPELHGAALGSLTAGKIDQIDRRLRYEFMSLPQAVTELGSAGIEEAMHFPRSIGARCRLEATAIPDIPHRKRPGRQSPYGMQHLSLGSTPGTPGFAPGTPLGLPAGFGGAFPTMSNPSVEDLSTPASPFLRHGTPASRRHSQLIEASPNLREEGSLDGRSITSYSFPGDSPAYSSSFHEDDHSVTFRGQSPTSYPGDFGAPIHWT
ncbi:MAG: hypothetical protein Q9218_001745 [Villophora microphyllina]